MCVGNRQLLQQLLSELAELRAAYERSPMRLEVAQINPGDVLVFTAERRMSLLEIDELTKGVKAQFPGVEGIVLDGGLHVSVVRPDTPHSPAGGS